MALRKERNSAVLQGALVGGRLPTALFAVITPSGLSRPYRADTRAVILVRGFSPSPLLSLMSPDGSGCAVRRHAAAYHGGTFSSADTRPVPSRRGMYVSLSKNVLQLCDANSHWVSFRAFEAACCGASPFDGSALKHACACGEVSLQGFLSGLLFFDEC